MSYIFMAEDRACTYALTSWHRTEVLKLRIKLCHDKQLTSDAVGQFTI